MMSDEQQGTRPYPRYLNLGRIPVRLLTATAPPEAYDGKGRWSVYGTRADALVKGRYVTAKRLEALCREYDRLLEESRPFLEESPDVTTQPGLPPADSSPP